MTGHPPAAALIDLLTQPLSARGLDLEGVEVSRAGRRLLVRVMVDKDGGITLDDIAEATGFVSGELDASDVLGEQPYTLEVTSPGVDRPLTLPRHWRRNVDRLVTVTATTGETMSGRIASADDDRVVLTVAGGAREVAYADIASARVEVEFNAPRPQRAGRESRQE